MSTSEMTGEETFSYDELKEYEYPFIALTGKNRHVVRELSSIINEGDYEILTKNEIQKIFNAIEDSYYFYFVLKQNYLNKGYRYTT